jgi:hypothetical protein
MRAAAAKCSSRCHPGHARPRSRPTQSRTAPPGLGPPHPALAAPPQSRRTRPQPCPALVDPTWPSRCFLGQPPCTAALGHAQPGLAPAGPSGALDCTTQPLWRSPSRATPDPGRRLPGRSCSSRLCASTWLRPRLSMLGDATAPFGF